MPRPRKLQLERNNGKKNNVKNPLILKGNKPLVDGYIRNLEWHKDTPANHLIYGGKP